MKRKATAQWKGNLKDGVGTLETESGVLSKTPYSFRMRFENQQGTNPEELIAAAHAGCFAMAMSAELEKQGLTAESIEVQAHVSLEKTLNEWSIPAIHLQVTANIPNATDQQMNDAARGAKINCPVSKLLKANITLEANFKT